MSPVYCRRRFSYSLSIALLAFSVVAGSASAGQVRRLNNQVVARLDVGWHDHALTFADNAVKKAATKHGVIPRESSNSTPRITPDNDGLRAAEQEIVKLNRDRKYDDATKVAARTLEIFEKAFGLSSPKIVRPLVNLAHAYANERRTESAERLYRRALEIAQTTLGPDHAETAATIVQLSRFYSAEKRYSDAESLYKRLLEIDERVRGKDHPDTLVSGKYLAQLYTQMGKYDLAISIYQQILATEERLRGLDDSETLNTKGLLAQQFEQLRHYEVAETLEKEILEAKERVFGIDNPSTLTTVAILAGIYDDTGRPGEAERLYKRALEGRERRLGLNDSQTLKTVTNLATLYTRYGRYAEAAELCKRVIESSDLSLPESDLRIVARTDLAVALMYQGRHADAEPLLREAWKMAERRFGPEGAETLRAMVNLAAVYRARKDYNDAAQLLEKVIAAHGPREAMNTLAVTYVEMGHSDHTSDWTRRARQLLSQLLQAEENEHVSNPLTLNNMAMTYLSERDWVNAVRFLRRATDAQLAARKRDAEGLGRAALGTSDLLANRRDRSEFINLVKALNRSPIDSGRSRASVIREMFEVAQEALDTEAAKSLSQMAIRGSAGNPPLAAMIRERQDLVEEWRVLDSLHNEALAQPSQKRDKASEAAVLAKLKSIDVRIAKLDKKLAVEFPEFTALAGAAPSTVEDVQSSLGPDEALVLFFDTPISAAPEETFVWLLTKTEVQLFRSPVGTPTLSVAVSILRCGLDRIGNWAWVESERRWQARKETCRDLRPNGLSADEDLPFDVGLAHELYGALFGDFEDLVKGKRLIIIPSGPLTQLPFQALVSQGPKDASPAPSQRQIAKLGAELQDLSDEDRRRLLWKEQGGVRVASVQKGTPADTAGLKSDDILVMVGGEKVWATQNAIQAVRSYAPGSRVSLGVFKDGVSRSIPVVLDAAIEDVQQAVNWNAKSAHEIHWLAQDHAITMLPAVSSLKALRELARPSHANQEYIGFGNPLLSGEPEKYAGDAAAAMRAQTANCQLDKPQSVAFDLNRGGGVRSVSANESLIGHVEKIRIQQPLPETAQELCDVAQELGVDSVLQTYIGARATEAEVKNLSKEGELAKYKIIHFATHGFVAGELSTTSEPGLVLTPPETASETDDGYLSDSEIAGLKLDADWVILSACNTAAGRTNDADALSGLARAFFYAGARSLLVSHWAIDSTTTVSLITKVASELKENHNIGRAEALRRSMLSLINEGDPHSAHPALWAPFILVGEGAALQ